MPDPSPFRFVHAQDSPGFVLWKLTGLWKAKVASALQPFGLTQTQYALLASLLWFDEHDDEPTQRGLAEHAGLDTMTLSKAVRRLEAAGLVSRRSAPHDSRATQVRFTDDGRDVVRRAVKAVEDTDGAFFAGLDGRDLRRWQALSRDLIEVHTRQRVRAATSE